jgi:hypothetical protein
MTNPDPLTGVREIADLLAWARRLSEARHHTDSTDRAAFVTTKDDLLARLAHPDDHDHEPTTKDTP